MDITVQMLGESHALKVDPRDTVGYLKSRIQDKLRVAPHKQRLIFDNGKRTTLDEDSKTISDYNLQSGSVLSLLIIKTFQVFLKRETDAQHTYDITANMTVEDLKNEVEARERVPVSQQSLIHEGREMNKGKLSDYNVREQSTIYLTLHLRGG